MKKLVIFVLVALFMFSTSINSFAKVTSNDEDAKEIVDLANQKIQDIIDNTILKSESIQQKYVTGVITLEQKDIKVQALIEKMLSKTNKISAKAVKSAAKLGVKVECSFVEVLIDNQIILVDPLFIVGT